MTAFALLTLFEQGQDVRTFMRLFKGLGYNVLRVWPYTPWPTNGWAWPSSTQVVFDFLAVAKEEGFYVELTLLTDDDPARLGPARDLVTALSANRQIENVLLEIGNEPTTHKNIDTPALRSVCEASGYLFASGDYESLDLMPNRVFGSYSVDHSSRDGEWPRKAKGLIEIYDGWGPWEEGGDGTGGVKHPAFPGVRHPVVEDEPIRPDQSGYNAEDYKAYGGVASIMGAGATFHYYGGEFGRLPDDNELRCAQGLAAGLNAFPADAPTGAYRRIDEGAGTLRTYIISNHMVRVRPTTGSAPEGGWNDLDGSGMFWSR